MYPDLIRTICTSLTGTSDGRPELCLMPNHASGQVDERGRSYRGTIEIPESMTPQAVRAEYLPSDETFLDNAELLLGQQAPQTLFAIPPWLNERKLTKGFRKEHEVSENRQFRDLDGDVPFFEVTQMMRSDRFRNSINFLKEQRDADSHRRINRSNIPTPLLEDLEKALRTIYEECGFVGDYRLIQVTRAKFDSIGGKTEYAYADLTGDNPLVAKRVEITTQAELEVDSLYLRDRQNKLHLFRPFLHYLECPECHLMSTFHLDTYPGTGTTVGLKSFERNSVREEEFAEQFQWAGLLKQGESLH